MADASPSNWKPVARRLGDHARDGVATIKVGPESVPYHVHKSLLAQHSEYFDRALNGNWKESDEGVITLEDVDCNTFEIFVDWVYTQKVPSKASSWSKDLPFRAALRYKAVEMALLKARVFADRFLASEFGHVVEYTYIQWMIDSGSRWYEAVAYAYQNLPAESLVLTAMINTHVHHFRSWTDNEDNEDIHHRDKLPQSFLVGVMLRYAWLIENKAARKKLVPCDYHIHDSLGDKDKCQAAVYSLQDDISDIDEGEEVKEE